MKTIITIMIGVFLLSSISAMYAGECMEIDLGDLKNSEEIAYIIVGNSSNTEGLNVTLKDITKNVSICTEVNYKPDSFIIIFIDNSTKETIKEVNVYRNRGSGGTRTIYIENETIKYVDNTIIEYVDRVVDSPKEPTPTDEPEELEKSYLIWYLSIAALILILGYLFYRLFLEEEEEEPANAEPSEQETPKEPTSIKSFNEVEETSED